MPAMKTLPVRLLLVLVVSASSANAAENVDFQRQVRPLLADKCFACHGRDAEHRQGSLRLDDRKAALKGGDSGEAAIVPNRPEQSELVRRIFSRAADERMPPPDSKKELNAAEKELLKRWVAEGAEYKAHWAFTAPLKPSVPKVAGTLRVPLSENNAPNDGTRSVPATEWVQNDIDYFILACLEKEGLSPSPPAERTTLLRRLTLDLTGLPPTVKELDDFLAVPPSLPLSVSISADKDRETERQRDGGRAFEAAVERLLRSPHYGERWGRIWLDGARYADSDGYEKDKPRFVWAYRDWVVGALNRDLPYNQFVIEQL